MKHLCLIPDGMADEPQEDLGGKTPLEFAKTPCLDALATGGEVGLVETVPEAFPPGSEIAILNIMGYPPAQYFTGRGAMEARAQGIATADDDLIFRCNFVATDGATLLDFSGGHISTKEAQVLLREVTEKLGSRLFSLYPGVSYRHILVWKRGGAFSALKCTPPHNIMGEPLKPHLPQGEGASKLQQFIWDSLEILDSHDENKKRRDQGKSPANMLWPWSPGHTFSLPSFQERFHKSGAVITAVDLVRGIARAAELDVVPVEGATGYYDTNYEGKGRAALAALKQHDFVLVHLEAPDEAGHNGDLDEKVRAIENFDRRLLSTILEELKPPFALLVLPDHPTPVRVRTHVRADVPYLHFHSEVPQKNPFPYSEEGAKAVGKAPLLGDKLLHAFFQGDLEKASRSRVA